jgi:hypothetical protein
MPISHKLKSYTDLARTIQEADLGYDFSGVIGGLENDGSSISKFKARPEFVKAGYFYNLYRGRMNHVISKGSRVSGHTQTLSNLAIIDSEEKIGTIFFQCHQKHYCSVFEYKSATEFGEFIGIFSWEKPSESTA